MIHEGGWQLARFEHGRLLAIPSSQAHRSWFRAPDAAVGSGRRALWYWDGEAPNADLASVPTRCGDANHCLPHRQSVMPSHT
jgi:hypothetical protein